ncbi:VasI family type VI secretion protein [Trabulsiella guamensis ATCC 49490]|uniref:VasI family type VI secretion protein n=1 Tax=Trabulsiella guamensis ATCC 49490 TaxID=1005994 RepID=A0A085A502_9ENTR|nr:type VI secretion system-associated protein VasI [Trabulsiella guamensis]KFC05297.1 VasI family type VI secretion protein [Trabulsiella guamensis ATCC 49490]
MNIAILLLMTGLLAMTNPSAFTSVNMPLPAATTNTHDTDVLSKAMRCRSESSPLLRLDCYDSAFSDDGPQMADVPVAKGGVAWQRAMDQEKTRDDHTTAFISTNSGGDNPQVILTTPAIGETPPRPVLMFSCVDNITRLQIAVAVPLKSGEGNVLLKTDRNQYDVNWFIRENGYLLDASRGLAGIEEIKQLFGSESVTVSLPGRSSPHLIFNIEGLAQEIEPLRKACHW